MVWLRRKNRQDLLGGLVMIAIGVLAMLVGQQYSIGTLARMGPGFFPVALGAILAVLGILIMLTADDVGAPDPDGEQEEGPPQWRGWACIILGMVAFIVLGGLAGLVPATFALVFISALGDTDQTVPRALLLALGVTAAGAFIFTSLLELQFPLFRWG